MSYRIEYAPQRNARKKAISGRNKMFLLIMVLILLTAVIRFSNLQDQFLPFLLPGDPQVTQAALLQMIHQLQEGTDIHKAVAVFCQQILDGAAFEIS